MYSFWQIHFRFRGGKFSWCILCGYFLLLRYTAFAENRKCSAISYCTGSLHDPVLSSQLPRYPAVLTSDLKFTIKKLNKSVPLGKTD